MNNLIKEQMNNWKREKYFEKEKVYRCFQNKENPQYSLRVVQGDSEENLDYIIQIYIVSSNKKPLKDSDSELLEELLSFIKHKNLENHIEKW